MKKTIYDGEDGREYTHHFGKYPNLKSRDKQENIREIYRAIDTVCQDLLRDFKAELVLDEVNNGVYRLIYLTNDTNISLHCEKIRQEDKSGSDISEYFDRRRTYFTTIELIGSEPNIIGVESKLFDVLLVKKGQDLVDRIRGTK